jgi:8-oxo-dGTP pyrophosphatase MutT (NUDIX family)
MNVPQPPSKQPIPEHAQKVFSGIIFDVYQWKQEMYDGSFETFEKLKRVDTVGVIPITPDGKILISQQEQPSIAPFWGTFGGRIDPGESPFEAAQRELLEESGYTSDQWQLWQAFQPLEKIEWSIYTFIAKNCQPIATSTPDVGEKITIKEVTFNEFLKISQQPDFRDSEITMEVLAALADPIKMEKLRELLLK